MGDKPPGWEPEDPLLVRLHDARLEKGAPLTADDRARLAAGETITFDPVQRRQEALADLVVSTLCRSPLDAPDVRVPVVVRLPEGVDADRAMEWIRGCERLGLLEPHPAGYLFLPPGVLDGC